MAESAAPATTTSSITRGLGARIAIGVVLGVLYIWADVTLDERLGKSEGLADIAITLAHEVIDFVLPVVAGAALGIALHYLRVRATIAADERRRAEELRARLHKVERDQAVWVVAASLLHELKNPLHALGLLLDEVDSAGDARDREASLARARAQADRLRGHLDTLKALPSRGRPDLRDVELGDLVAGLVRELRGALPGEVALKVKADPGVRARVAEGYLRIILQTLLENAADVAAESKDRDAHDVEIEIAREGDRPIVRVRDHGPGIDAERSAAIFEPLATTKQSGLGLGLPIARALSRAMGGELSLERSAPRETTFRLELTGQ